MNFFKLSQIIESFNEEEQGFLRAIEENPDDSMLKLVFADWLEERGRNDLADYIRAKEGMKMHTQDYFKSSYSGTPGHSYEKARELVRKSENSPFIKNLPHLLYPTQNNVLADIYTQADWGSGSDYYTSLKVSHVKIHYFPETQQYPSMPPYAAFSVYKSPDSDLVGQILHFDVGNDEINVEVTPIGRQREQGASGIIQGSRFLVNPEIILLSIERSKNDRTYKEKFARQVSYSTPFIPFSPDPKKGYGKIQIEFVD